MNCSLIRLRRFRYGVVVLMVFAAILFVSCSVEKRHYRSGVYIDWNTGHSRAVEDVIVKDVAERVADPASTDSILPDSAGVSSFAKHESQNSTETKVHLQQMRVDRFLTPADSDSEEHTTNTIAVPVNAGYDEGDDLRLALYALGSALAGFLLVTLLFDFLPVLVPTLIAVAGLLAALFFLVFSIRWHLRRNRKRKEAGEATTHREAGRRVLHALMVIATIFTASFTLLLAVFLTDW